jgi:hypothetical protein
MRGWPPLSTASAYRPFKAAGTLLVFLMCVLSLYNLREIDLYTTVLREKDYYYYYFLHLSARSYEELL